MFFVSLKMFLWKHTKYIKSRLLATLVYTIFPIVIPVIILFNTQTSRVVECDAANMQIGLLMFVLWMFNIIALVTLVLSPIVEEKESGIKEFLRISSSYSFLNMVVFFVFSVTLNLVAYSVVLLVLWFSQWTKYFNVMMFFLLIALHVTSSVAFAFLLSVIFKSEIIAKIAGIVLYFGQNVLFLVKGLRFLTPLFSQTQFLTLVFIFSENTQQCNMVDWHVFTYSEPGHHTMFAMYMFLVFDTLLYLALYFYLSEVFPGTYGTPKPFWFPCQSSTYFRQIKSSETFGTSSADSADRQVIVKVRGLTKQFKRFCAKPFVAVDNLNLDIYRNEITVMLGHNGAGKTTTMAMIVGIIPKTSGSIVVDGEENLDAYRHKIGYCPQHNVCMTYFTCVEHLIFFGRLRGLSADESHEQSTKLLDYMHMTHKAKEYSRKLSGGMLRRLCLGTAIMGDTQIAILDEPTSGLDPESRRELWNVLLLLRKKQSILITTHYMEEAEMLADSVSIMSQGQIICEGSSIQLKRQYATGYVLKLLTTDDFDQETLMAKIQQTIPTAAIKSFVKPTIYISLPYTDLKEYPAVLRSLEGNMNEYGIVNISMTDATLEDVFLNCDPHKKEPEEFTKQTEDSSAGHLEPTNGCSRIKHEVMAICFKKIIYIQRNSLTFLFMLGILIVATFLAFISLNSAAHNPLVFQFIMSVAFFTFLTFFAFLPFIDESTEFKKLLPIGPSVYWLTTFLFDLSVVVLVCGTVTILHIPMDKENVLGNAGIRSLFFIYVAFGMVTLPLTYISAKLVRTLAGLYSLLCFMFFMPHVLASYLSAPDKSDRYSVLVSIFMVLPGYAFNHALMTFTAQPLRTYFIYTIVVTVVLTLFLIFAMEHLYCRECMLSCLHGCRRRILCRRPPKQMPTIAISPDVRAERDRTEFAVISKTVNEYAICVHQLQKKYELFEAVRNVSFTVPKGQCFGLLGMNGAGKTTMFKMMVRNVSITSGKIYLNGLDSVADASAYKHTFGYCPQVDALSPFMTAYESVKFMALVRGTPMNQIEDRVTTMLKRTDLLDYRNVQVKNYSGGTKRKLNTALALLTHPSLVFLDEPTTGVDPSSRRFIWSCIQNSQQQNRNIVLTSHSMDECEFLCNRLAIMNHGQLNCIGPVLELRTNFQLGFVITIELMPTTSDVDRENIRKAVHDHFDCILREDYGSQQCYQVNSTNLLWSDVFNRLDELRQTFELIGDISVTESSLEDIFLKIARQTIENMESFV